MGVQPEEQMHDTMIALADPKRRAILRRLSQGDACVTELAAPFNVSLNAISKHIKLLERAGLIQRRKIGREHMLRFNPKPLDQVENWIVKQKAFWDSSLAAIDEMLQQDDRAEKR